MEKDKISEKINDKIRDLMEKGKDSINAAIGEGYRKDSRLVCVKDIEIRENYIVVRLQGAVDTSTIPVFQDRYKHDRETFDKNIIIDFRDVKHIDCSTLATLVNLFIQLKAHDKKLAVINATDEFLGYTDILGLRPIINVFGDEQEAVESFS